MRKSRVVIEAVAIIAAALLGWTAGAHAQSWNWQHDPYYNARPFVQPAPTGPAIIEVPQRDARHSTDKVLHDIAECRPVRISGDGVTAWHPASECDTSHPFK